VLLVSVRSGEDVRVIRGNLHFIGVDDE
jgi:hypothetical protein